MSQKGKAKIHVERDPGEVFDMWINFENFPKFMKYITRVEKTDERHSRWKMRVPPGMVFHWKSELDRVEEDKYISWHGTGGDVGIDGEIEFEADGNGGTDVTVEMEVELPGGPIGDLAGRLLVDPRKMVKENLIRFKEYAESDARM